MRISDWSSDVCSSDLPSYQWVKANGGGVEDLREGFRNVGGVDYTGYIGGGYYYGRDLNGDGDIGDRVGGLDPSQTNTRRYGVIASLNYDINDDHHVRLAYTWDRARHRQTGSTNLLQLNGEPIAHGRASGRERVCQDG